MTADLRPRDLEPSQPPRKSAAETLRGLAGTGDGDRITVEEIVEALGGNGFGLLVLALALPNAIPGPMIPGFSVPFALGIILLGLQIMGGNSRPLLPRWLRRRTITRVRFRRFIERADPWLSRFERRFKPRAARILHDSGRPRVLGLLIILFALVLALPIPLGNGPEAFAICVIGLGLFASDGRVQTIGIVGGVLATCFNAAIVIAGLQLIRQATGVFG
ncbi:MAG: exopolysaccharide biosynthesis protein [Stellaceae bacterium]